MCFNVTTHLCYNYFSNQFLMLVMPYEEFQRLIGKSGLSIKEFAALLDMNHNSITNYKKLGKVPTHIAIIVALLSTMKDDGVDFYPILEKISQYKSSN